MNYFFYSLNTQFANTGDLLINKALIDILSKKGVVYLEDYNKPLNFIDSLIGENIVLLTKVSDKSKILDFLNDKLHNEKSIDDEYFLVLVPGDLSKSGFKMALKSLSYALQKLSPLKSRGVKIIRLGISLGYFDFFNGYVESFYSKIYHYYAVRDKKSLKIAKKYDFSNLDYFPDLAWAYRWENKAKMELQEKKYIVLSFRSNASGKEHDENYIENISKDLKEILLKSSLRDYKIIVSYQVEYDRKASEFIYNYFKDEFETEFIDRNLNIEEAPELYFNAKCVITNRLHVFMLAFLTNTLSIPLIDRIDNKKIWNILEDNDIDDLILDRRLPSEENKYRLNNIITKEDFWVKKFNESKSRNFTIILEKLNNLFDNQ